MKVVDSYDNRTIVELFELYQIVRFFVIIKQQVMKMDEYLKLFMDDEYPEFIDKYLKTKTLNRLKYITQFCGCDYTKLYSPLFLYTRYDHSLVVAHMTWHFTHDKKETIVALLHDIGTPCFAHCIDYVFGDYIEQESSERKITDIISSDLEIQKYLKEDGILIEELDDFSNYHILENKSPKLCTDRLDGVLHTCYIWLHTHTLQKIKEVYDDMTVLENEYGYPEIGFQNLEIAEKFVLMVYNYAKELQGNTDKYIMKYVSEIVKLAFQRNLISLDDLYTKEEKEICDIFASHFRTWHLFNETHSLMKTDTEPTNSFYISFDTKKRNTIPLIQTPGGNKRITEISAEARKKYEELKEYKDSKYAYVKKIGRIN